MKPTIPLQLEDGNEIFVEVDAVPPPDHGRAGRGGVPLPERAVQTFHEAVARITPMANAIAKRILLLDVTPSEVEVTFGLKFTAEAGVVISSTSAEANLEFKLKWTPKKKNDGT